MMSVVSMHTSFMGKWGCVGVWQRLQTPLAMKSRCRLEQCSLAETRRPTRSPATCVVGSCPCTPEFWSSYVHGCKGVHVTELAEEESMKHQPNPAEAFANEVTTEVSVTAHAMKK